MDNFLQKAKEYNIFEITYHSDLNFRVTGWNLDAKVVVHGLEDMGKLEGLMFDIGDYLCKKWEDCGGGEGFFDQGINGELVACIRNGNGQNIFITLFLDKKDYRAVTDFFNICISEEGNQGLIDILNKHCEVK